MPMLDVGRAEWLERLFEEEEVKKAIWMMDGLRWDHFGFLQVVLGGN